MKILNQIYLIGSFCLIHDFLLVFFCPWNFSFLNGFWSHLEISHITKSESTKKLKKIIRDNRGGQDRKNRVGNQEVGLSLVIHCSALWNRSKSSSLFFPSLLISYLAFIQKRLVGFLFQGGLSVCV